MYLLDTNVISDGVKPQPNPAVTQWLQIIPSNQIFLSVITIGEITRGITKQAGTKRSLELSQWLETDLCPRFAGRILPIDEAIMRVWGEFYAQAVTQGNTPPMLDSLLAATAIKHGLILVTRNTKDIAMLPVTTLNPWITP
jgi:toxin FitB